MSERPQGRDREERHEPHTPYEWHEPTDGPEQEHTQPHAGNETVNHSPDELGPKGLDSDELALRRMLHEAVQDMEPRDGALDHLQRAVPARRARKRQAAVGMAAAALFIGTAVPALVHVSNAGADADPSIAANSSQAQGGSGQGKNPGSGAGNPGTGGGQSTGSGKSGQKGKGTGGGSGSPGGVNPSASALTGAPLCTAAQLDSATSSVAGPDSAGIVYGTFHVVNVSSDSCTVGAQGDVGTLAEGSADAGKISVVQHTSGDAAAALPDPSTEAAQLVLLPGAAYEVKFAWVASETCPTSGGTGGTDTGGGTGGSDSGGTTASPSPTQDTSGTGGTDTSSGISGTSTQMLRADGTTDGSVVVSYTTEAGSPTVSATVTGACAGTVYRTGVLPTS